MSASPARRQSPGERRLRILMLAMGAGLLLWLPVEDANVRPALLFAAALAGLGARRILARRILAANTGLLLPLAGLLAGLAVAPLALGLLVFKNGLHGHPQPDFTLAQAASLLRTTPAWGAGGLLVGLGLALWRKGKLEAS